jgi:hypothetical protein
MVRNLGRDSSERIVQTLEPALVISIKKSVIDNFFESSFIFENLVRVITESTLVLLDRRIDILRTKDIEARLSKFEFMQPELSNRVPLKYVASLLNITPHTLSRVRAKRQRKSQ